MARPAFDFAGRLLGCLRADTDRAAPAAVRVVLVEPDVGEPVVIGRLQNMLGLRKLRVAHRFQRRDAHTGIQKQLLGGKIGIAAGESAPGRRGIHAHRRRFVRIRGVVEVRHRVGPVSGRPDLVHPFGRRIGLEHLGRNGHRVHVGVDDGDRYFVFLIGLRPDPFDGGHLSDSFTASP